MPFNYNEINRSLFYGVLLGVAFYHEFPFQNFSLYMFSFSDFFLAALLISSIRKCFLSLWYHFLLRMNEKINRKKAINYLSKEQKSMAFYYVSQAELLQVAFNSGYGCTEPELPGFRDSRVRSFQGSVVPGVRSFPGSAIPAFGYSRGSVIPGTKILT